MTKRAWGRITASVGVALLNWAMPRVSYATLMELTVSGTTNGSVYGFPDTFVTQTVLFDNDAVPVADDNSAVSQYPIVSYELDFGGTAFTPITQPQIEIVDGSVDPPANTDMFQLRADLNDGVAGFLMQRFVFFSFDLSNTAISDQNLPTSVSYFDQFAYPRCVQIEFRRVSDTMNTGISLSDMQVTLTPLPEPATISFLAIASLGLLRRQR